MLNRLLLLLAPAIVCTGCWIQITVPEGGTVLTSSGAYSCDSGEVCYIEVADVHFDETFHGIPSRGYVFSSWRSRDSGLCVGESEPCRLYTSFFPDTPLMQFLAPEPKHFFHLEPVFCKLDGWDDRKLFLAQNFVAERTENLVYGKGAIQNPRVGKKNLLLDVYQPVCEQPSPPGQLKPAVITVHGGGYTGGSKDEFYNQAFAFASRGYVAVSINHRLTGDDPPTNHEDYPSVAYPEDLVRAALAAVEDTVIAIHWLRDNADSLGVDPDRIAIYGESSGAVNALNVGIWYNNAQTDPKDRVRAVVALSTFVDVFTPFVDESDPAVYTTHFLGDEITPASPEQLDAFEAALTSAGVDHEVIRFDSVGHGGSFVGAGFEDGLFEFLYDALDLEALVP